MVCSLFLMCSWQRCHRCSQYDGAQMAIDSNRTHSELSQRREERKNEKQSQATENENEEKEIGLHSIVFVAKY